jgi:DNA (cytosine-5)-methyltransferase 1
MATRNFVSLFTGAMGLDLGLETEGFSTIVCNEVDDAALRTIRLNRPLLPVIPRPIEELGADDFSEAAGREVVGLPLLAGGPPCQAFAIFGRRRGLNDERGRLIFEFVRMVDELRPQAFVMENVRGLHSMSLVQKGHSRNGHGRNAAEHGSLLRKIIREFEATGYRVDCYVVNAVNYGAPQIRERVMCVGNPFDLETSFPPPRYSNRPEDGLPPFKTLGETIGDGFADPDPSLMDFSARKKRYLEMVPPGGNWRSLPEDVQKEAMGGQWYLKGGRSSTWRKLSFDFPCPTIQTMPNHAATSMCHPTEIRALTVGECAAIQEFPAGWRFAGSPTEKMRQIGNAVPVRLGQAAGEAARELLDQIAATNPTPCAPTIPSTVTHLRPHVRTRSFWRDGKALAGSHDYFAGRGSQLSLDY